MVIGICDDDKVFREYMMQKIKTILPDAKTVPFSTGDMVLRCCMDLDLLFLDIRLPDIDGMQVAKKIRQTNKKLQIVFITGMEEYVFQAFDVGALNFLVKPLQDKKIAEVLVAAEEKIAAWDSQNQSRSSIMVSAGGTHTKIYLDELIYAEVFNRKIVLHTITDEIEYYGTMSELEQKAGDGFFRPHRAYLVNMKYIVRYDAANIYLDKGQVSMAKQNYKNFVNCYKLKN